MTGRPPRVCVHIERVVLHGVPAMSPEVLAASIEAALADGISGGSPAPEAGAGAQEGRRAAQVGRAVAPAVLSAAGISPADPAGGPA
jgi:hypothetical protein